MLSRDSVTVSVDAVCFYKISNPLAAVCNVGNYTHSTNLLVATSLRNVLGEKRVSADRNLYLIGLKWRWPGLRRQR